MLDFILVCLLIILVGIAGIIALTDSEENEDDFE